MEAIQQIVSGDSLEEAAACAAQVLARNAVIVYPTETLYGLGVNALLPESLEKLIALKRRALQKGIILLIRNSQEARKFVSDLTPQAKRLMDLFWPGPLTLIVQANAQVPDLLLGEGGTVAMRVSSHPFCQLLLAKIPFPITSTSANLSGQTNLLKSKEIVETFSAQVELIILDQQERNGKPSTVLDVTGQHYKLIREGMITQEEIDAKIA